MVTTTPAGKIPAGSKIFIGGIFHEVAHITPSWSEPGRTNITLANGTVLVEKPDTIFTLQG